MRPRGRKGQAEMIVWFSRLIMLALAVIAVALLVRYFADREVDPVELHMASYLYRIHYDGNIVMRSETETGRTYPGVVDMEKFTSERLNAIFGTEGPMSSMLTLQGRCIDTAIAYHNALLYEEKIGLARFGALGPGSAAVQEAVFPVTIQSGQESCPGLLNITIVRANS